MAKKALIEKWKSEPKFEVRRYNRCKVCGRPHGYMRKFGLCPTEETNAQEAPVEETPAEGAPVETTEETF